MSRQHRPDIHAARIQNEMIVLCAGERCEKAKYRNAISVWTKQMYCSRCRGRKAKR